ncbi:MULTISPECIES: HAD family hydrolase [Campylobacter]|uniref:HAD family hydrolase n=1 Tax=Campylobacter TaxID=194 RepID=UPI0023F33C8B|nr:MULTISPECIES: HAD family hydrolase [Campylobacter]MCI6642374.1 HAD family hydrolase [Campylobacter sp.]MDD7422626.1 HAD family hydrolase [Campylobacter hominis]MDY3116884.1 HAD family hydrolase [Campylobacter hominis]
MNDTTILFDLDGTLIDSTAAILESFKFSFEMYGEICPQDEKITELIGYPLDYMFIHLGVENQKEKIENHIKFYKMKYHQVYLDKTSLISEAKEALKKCHQFADLGVVTTKTSKFSKILLNNLGIGTFFKTIIGREDAKNPKPNAEPILNALKMLKKSKEQAFMIGDTILDLKSAINANVTPIALTCGYGKLEDLQKFTKYIFSTPFEAANFISNLKK